MRQAMGEHWARLSGLLFGRRTYEEVLGYWNRVADNPFARPLNEARKYVVSSTLREPLPWPNSTLLAGDAVEAVARLKAEPGDELGIMGSGVLIGTLLAHDLIDEFLLMIHPIVLGSGRRLFPHGVPPTELTLVDARTSPTGVLIATYRTDRPTG
jgi:dihydrofolate reductase